MSAVNSSAGGGKVMKITIQQQLDAAKRELQMRKKVYPRRVERGLMRQTEADYEIATMTAIVETLKPLVPAQKGLFDV